MAAESEYKKNERRSAQNNRSNAGEQMEENNITLVSTV